MDERREGGVIGPEPDETNSQVRRGTEEKKEKAMIARFDHRPMLTALLALSTIVLVVVVITLSTLLITSTPTVSPSSVGHGGNPGAGAANPAGRMDAGGKGYGMPVEEPAQTGNSAGSAGDRHAEVVAAMQK